MKPSQFLKERDTLTTSFSKEIKIVFSVDPIPDNGKRIAKVLDALRFAGMDYQRSYERVKREVPELEVSLFDEFCLMADNHGN